jgi:hypothetical protein
MDSAQYSESYEVYVGEDGQQYLNVPAEQYHQYLRSSQLPLPMPSYTTYDAYSNTPKSEESIPSNSHYSKTSDGKQVIVLSEKPKRKMVKKQMIAVIIFAVVFVIGIIVLIVLLTRKPEGPVMAGVSGRPTIPITLASSTLATATSSTAAQSTSVAMPGNLPSNTFPIVQGSYTVNFSWEYCFLFIRSGTFFTHVSSIPGGERDPRTCSIIFTSLGALEIRSEGQIIYRTGNANNRTVEKATDLYRLDLVVVGSDPRLFIEDNSIPATAPEYVPMIPYNNSAPFIPFNGS